MAHGADTLLLGFCKELLADLVANQAVLSAAQVRGFERVVRGRVEEVRPYERNEAFAALRAAQGVLPARHQAALDWYRAGGSEANAELKGHGAGQPGAEGAGHYHGVLDEAFRQAPPLSHPVVVYRGRPFSPGFSFRGKTYPARGLDPESLRPGAVVDDPGFASTSTDPEAAAVFTNDSGTLFRITLPPGQRALLPGNEGEQEVLLPRGTRFRVKAVHPVSQAGPGRARVVDAEVA